MLMKIGVGLAVLIVGFVVVVATRPDRFHIERSATIAAPPDVVFAQLDDFHKWSAWSPWEALDPTMKKTFDGPASGAGAVYSWVGNDKVGEGRMTIVAASAPSQVDIKLEFLKPWQATNQALFTLAPSDGGTRVVWAMNGTNNFAAKAFSLFMDMDKMVGGDFERGLAKLKTVSETHH